MNVDAGWRVMRSYQRNWLRADLLAGISVGVLAIPSVIAYAELAGLPPQTGLVTAVLGMLAYAIFGASRQVIVGPDAAIALLIAAGVGPLAGGDPWRAAGLASLLAIIVVRLLQRGVQGLFGLEVAFIHPDADHGVLAELVANVEEH